MFHIHKYKGIHSFRITFFLKKVYKNSTAVKLLLRFMSKNVKKNFTFFFPQNFINLKIKKKIILFRILFYYVIQL